MRVFVRFMMMSTARVGNPQFRQSKGAVHPERWNGRSTRSWSPVRSTSLNPVSQRSLEPIAKRAA